MNCFLESIDSTIKVYTKFDGGGIFLKGEKIVLVFWQWLERERWCGYRKGLHVDQKS